MKEVMLANNPPIQWVLDYLDDQKAEDIVTFPWGQQSLADYVVIASGRSTKHVSHLAQGLYAAIKSREGRIPQVEGLKTSNWVLVDTGDWVIHLFYPPVREYYRLEDCYALKAQENTSSPSFTHPLEV